MERKRSSSGRWWIAVGAAVCASQPVFAGAHTWDVHEVFSNASGTIQFIELLESNGGAAEGGVGSAGVSSVATGKASDACPNVTGSTANKRYLVATPAFAALPGAPLPNCTLSGPDAVDFFSKVADTIRYGSLPYDTLSFTSGQLPTDGVRSLFEGGTTGNATPTNYAGQTFAPPGVNGLLLEKLPGFPDGARLSFSWNVNCLGAARYHIVYGLDSDLPAALGGVYNLQAPGIGQCAIVAPPKVLTGIPAPAPGGFLWYLVLADNASTVEGSWGLDGSGGQRTGPTGGHSGQCSMTSKSIVNTCGQ